MHHWIVTAEALVAHSWFWYTTGRLPTAVVAFSMVPGLPRGPGVHFGVADLQRRIKVKFVRQSKSATDPHDSTTADRMNRSAPPVWKVVDQVYSGGTEGICHFIGRLIRTRRLSWRTPRRISSAIARIMVGR